MPQIVTHHKKIKPVWAVIVVVLVLTLALGLWQAYSWMQAAQAQAKYNAATSQAQSLEKHSHYAAEETILESYLRTNPPAKYRYTALIMLGNAAYANRQDADAVSDYKRAVTANGGKLTEIVAENIGQAAASAGDRATALSYFKQALALTQNQPGISNDASDLEATVKNLESTQ